MPFLTLVTHKRLCTRLSLLFYIGSDLWAANSQQDDQWAVCMIYALLKDEGSKDRESERSRIGLRIEHFFMPFVVLISSWAVYRLSFPSYN